MTRRRALVCVAVNAPTAIDGSSPSACLGLFERGLLVPALSEQIRGIDQR